MVAVVSVLVLVLPGFVIVDLQRRKRASVAADSDWELVLRAIGLVLNALLIGAERSGSLKWWHYALGGRDARQAWDYIFQRLETEGRWLVVKLASAGSIAGKFGTESWVSQSPASGDHDLWLEEIWTVDGSRVRTSRPCSLSILRRRRIKVWLSGTSRRVATSRPAIRRRRPMVRCPLRRSIRSPEIRITNHPRPLTMQRKGPHSRGRRLTETRRV